MSDELNLAALIADRKGTRSYDRLAEDCGGTPSSGRLHQMATRPLKNFPDPDSIRGMANGLGVTVTDIVMAAARSLDLPVYTGNDPSALSIGGAGTLPDSAKETLTTVAREFIKLTSQHEADGEADAQITESRTETGSEKQLGTSSGSEVRTPTMNDDDMIWRIRRESLIGHYEWVRGKAVEHSQLRMLTEQARNVLLTEPGNPGVDIDSVIAPEIDDGVYVQYLAWRRFLSRASDRSLAPLSEDDMRMANRRWRREFAELVLFGKMRTQGATDGASELALQNATSELEKVVSLGEWSFPDPADPSAGSGSFLAEAMAVMAGSLTASDQGPKLDSEDEDGEDRTRSSSDRQDDYALARREGETEERRRRRIEGEPWDHADPEGPETGA
ncbi:hypothetical protein HYG77_04990 [Rhodococcus sp. ZPP]|uniref:hypothetical protein n=1 Tax=Rhodococcus sp. ZPP TaxID=2749906 RepID=UPI001AD893D1|nr:hypothetical protein [Rhodococcus sp. ZPP]QTJ65019.1 hypothetical protein HYG77_04990 [Rhodococcus sp. ZPP]